MNRRGFLTALLGGAAALAVDPEKLLWKPGKLISIPSHRDRSLHVFGVDAEIPDELLVRSLEQFSRMYLQPAINALADRIDKEALRQFSRPRFRALPIPRIDGVCEIGRFGPIPEARLIKVRDPIRNQTRMRLDALVEI